MKRIEEEKKTHLILPRGLLRQRHDGRHADRQMVPADVVDARLLHGGPDVRRLKVLELVLVGGGQVRAHAAVVAGDDDAAAARRLAVVDAVLGAQAGVAACRGQDVGVFVAPHAADVEDGGGREDVLF